MSPGRGRQVFIVGKQNSDRYTYSGFATAWTRAVKRSGVARCTFHDLKAKAHTDVDEQRGIVDAQRMGGHSTQAQTADYVRQKKRPARPRQPAEV